MGSQRATDDLATAHHQHGSTLSGLDALAASWECGLGQVPHVPVYIMDLTILTPCLICKMSLIVTPLSQVSLVAQMVKNPHAIQEIQVQPLGQEDLLEKGMVTQSSVLARKIPWTEEPGGLHLRAWGRKESNTTE